MRYLINNTYLNVLEQGTDPLTLVFLHYFGGSVLEWQSVMQKLSSQYRCLAVDLRGCGDSDATATDYSVDTMADDIAEVIRVLNVQNFVLVGHSMSGKVALALAAGSTDRPQPAGLQALVLISPSPPVPEPILNDEREKLLTGYGQRSAAEQTLKNITAIPVSKVIREQIIADDLRTSKPAWDGWLTAGSREDISARMSSVTLPVSILVGSEDRALPPDVQTHKVIPYLKSATLDIVPKAGHLLPWETPDVVADFIRKKAGPK